MGGRGEAAGAYKRCIAMTALLGRDRRWGRPACREGSGGGRRAARPAEGSGREWKGVEGRGREWKGVEGK